MSSTTRLFRNERRAGSNIILSLLLLSISRLFTCEIKAQRCQISFSFFSLCLVFPFFSLYTRYPFLCRLYQFLSQATNERFYKHCTICILYTACQLLTCRNPINLKDKFSVTLKTTCRGFLNLWSVADGQFPLGKNLFLSPMVLALSKRLKGIWWIIYLKACWKMLSRSILLSENFVLNWSETIVLKKHGL